MSRKHRHKLNGIERYCTTHTFRYYLEVHTRHTRVCRQRRLIMFCFCRANSVTWNPHKMMGVPLQCSAILVREKVRERNGVSGGMSLDCNGIKGKFCNVTWITLDESERTTKAERQKKRKGQRTELIEACYQFSLYESDTLLCASSLSSVCMEQGLLQGCNSMCAGYLFQPDKQYDVTYDTGDKAIQCGRHVDIFKFWLMWKSKVSRYSTYDTRTMIDRLTEN